MRRSRSFRLRLGLLLACGLLLTAVALFRGELRSGAAFGETPKIADVVVINRGSRRKIAIRDQTAIVLLQSIVEGGEVVDSTPPGRYLFEVFIHPPGLSSYSYSPSPVWQTSDGTFVWRHAGRTTALNGSLTDFVKWLRVRRLNQLMSSLDPQLRERGKQLRDATGSELVESLIRIAKSSNGWFAQASIREIADFISVDPVRPDRIVPGEMHQPLRRSVVDPDRRVRNELLKLVRESPRTDHVNDPYGAADMALGCLRLIGDRATADELVKLLKQHQSGRLGDRLLTTIEQLYGIPKTYERFGICGNSSAAEIARYQREAAARQNSAIDDFVAWQQLHADDSDEEFYDAIAERWSEMLMHIATTANSYTFDFDHTPAPQLSNLIGLGRNVVPALNRRKQVADDRSEFAMLEFVIAFLTGECDADLVTSLLLGDVPQQRVACCIIAAAADPTWNDRLIDLLRTPIPDTGVEEVVVLRNVAAQALFRTLGAKSLAEFRAALAAGFDSQLLLQILDYHDIPEPQF